MPTNGLSIEPLKLKLLAGEQKATEKFCERGYSPLKTDLRQLSRAGRRSMGFGCCTPLERTGLGAR